MYLFVVYNENYFIVTLIIYIFCLQAKLDKTHNGKPSRVIHIRNIPNEVSEGEIIHLGIPFGRVTNVLVLKGKNQVRDFLLPEKNREKRKWHNVPF